jgi:hypothetical protein
MFLFIECLLTFQQKNLYLTPSRTPSQLEKYNFSGERKKTTGLGDAIASIEQRHFSHLAAILENRHVTLFHWVDIVSGTFPVGMIQNDLSLSCDTVFLGVRLWTATVPYLACVFPILIMICFQPGLRRL